jgi:hypothetical protein
LLQEKGQTFRLPKYSRLCTMTVNAKLFRFSLFWFVVLLGNSGKLFGSQVCDRGEVFDRKYVS